ncbi:MAG: hypothetical protein IPP72_09540 [Chitinophagaceae bacterium]|nr:hypothetical protein [Chitinophagaceae bacterium]
MTNNLIKAVTLAAIVLVSCEKENEHKPPVAIPVPEMELIDLHDTAIRYGKPVTVIDLDGDNHSDLKFAVILVGDPILQQDKHQYTVSSGVNSKLAVNSSEQAPVMNKGTVIPLADFNGYKWWLVSSVMMIQRIENMNGAIIWEGHWKDAVKKYLPFQLIKNNQRYNGWVELSVDVLQEKIVLHKIAVSKEAEREIKAG